MSQDQQSSPANQPVPLTGALSALIPLRDPRYYLAAPSDIDRQPLGKEKRGELHAVVHSFRATFGFDAEAADGLQPASYREALERYAKAIAPESERRAIDTLVSTYAEIRAAGRMRQSMGPVSAEELARLQVEIRAALIWKTLLGGVSRAGAG